MNEDTAAVVVDTTDEDLAEFAQRWAARSKCMNFQRLWWDENAGEWVDFHAIVDAEELKAASARAEAQYLARIDEQRREFLSLFPEGGASVYDHRRPPANQREALWHFERELAKRDKYYLGKYVLGYDRAVFHLHYFMCGTMDDLPPGYRGLREFPRDAYKTTFMGITYIVQENAPQHGRRCVTSNARSGTRRTWSCSTIRPRVNTSTITPTVCTCGNPPT